MRQYKIRKAISMMLIIASLIWISTLNSEAAEALPPVQPCYTNTQLASVTLGKQDGTAVCIGEVLGYTGTTIYLVEMILDQISEAGMPMMRIPWYGMSSSTNTFLVIKEVDVPTGFRYRLKLTAIVRDGTLDETVTVSTEKQF